MTLSLTGTLEQQAKGGSAPLRLTAHPQSSSVIPWASSTLPLKLMALVWRRM
jgi:hypothetical protein